MASANTGRRPARRYEVRVPEPGGGPRRTGPGCVTAHHRPAGPRGPAPGLHRPPAPPTGTGIAHRQCHRHRYSRRRCHSRRPLPAHGSEGSAPRFLRFPLAAFPAPAPRPPYPAPAPGLPAPAPGLPAPAPGLPAPAPGLPAPAPGLPTRLPDSRSRSRSPASASPIPAPRLRIPAPGALPVASAPRRPLPACGPRPGPYLPGSAPEASIPVTADHSPVAITTLLAGVITRLVRQPGR